MPGTVNWYDDRRFWLAVCLAMALPLLWPTVPPLVDLPGHMGRYRIELEIAQSRFFAENYAFSWQLIGNLGIDLLIIPMAKLFGLELGVKLIVIAIPVLTAAGLIAIAREIHGHVPPTVLFALPLAYGYPFHFGFVNFALAMALALLAFALWLRLGRTRRDQLRAALFVPIGLLLWLCHAFGWGMFGLLAFVAEWVRVRDRGATRLTAPLQAGLAMLPLLPPAALMLMWRTDGATAGQTADWFNFAAKQRWFKMMLADRWQGFDLASLGVLLGVLIFALRSRQLHFSRILGACALILVAIYVLMPRIVFGSAYADMRLAPFMLAIALIAIGRSATASPRFIGMVALAGLAFFALRIGATTVSFERYAARQQNALAALDHIPQGARVLGMVGARCGGSWATARLEHLPAMAIVRRRAFANDQWDMAGAQLLRVRKADAPGFVADPSELVLARRCRGERWRTLDAALVQFPRAAFDFVWLIDPPQHRGEALRGLTRVWSNGIDHLYRVDGVAPLNRDQ